MEHQQTFSHGLLYSVAPENMTELHLKDQEEALEWEEQDATLVALAKRLLAKLLP